MLTQISNSTEQNQMSESVPNRLNVGKLPGWVQDDLNHAQGYNEVDSIKERVSQMYGEGLGHLVDNFFEDRVEKDDSFLSPRDKQISFFRSRHYLENVWEPQFEVAEWNS